MEEKSKKDKKEKKHGKNKERSKKAQIANDAIEAHENVDDAPVPIPAGEGLMLSSAGSEAEGWEEFLRLTCQHCEVAATCAPAQDLLDFVKRIWGRIQSCSLNCWPGLQAVATVHKQFTAAGVIQEEHHLPDCLPSWQAGRERDGMSPIQRQRIRFWRPLFPFPLLGAQQLLYSQLHPVEPRTLCSLPDAGMYISRRFIPRGDLWESKCAVRRSDVQLLTTCRSRRDRGGDLFQHVLPPVHAHQLRVDSPAASSWSQRFDELRRGDRRLAGGKCLNHINETCVSPASCGFDLRRPFMPPCQAENVDLSQRRQSFFSLRCPNLINESAWWGWEDDTEGSEDEGNIGNMIDMKKYRIRASDGGCQSQRGTWSADVQDALKCVLVVIAERFSFRPGELLLEWGSGCGFAMSWAKAYYDVDSLGVDIMPAAAWAAKYSLGLSCVADGRKLQWIPNGLFDHVFSYGALRHLSFEEQCEVAHQLVRKLRIGGRAFIGWNRANLVGPWKWYDCFRADIGSFVELEVLEEANLFVEDSSKIAGSSQLTWEFPSYAVLLKKVTRPQTILVYFKSGKIAKQMRREQRRLKREERERFRQEQQELEAALEADPGLQDAIDSLIEGACNWREADGNPGKLDEAKEQGPAPFRSLEELVAQLDELEKSEGSGVPKAISVPHDPLNPLNAAYDMRAYEMLRKLRLDEEHQMSQVAADEPEWDHLGYLRRSPSPCRLRTNGTMWPTRKGAWRSRAGGVYLPPEMAEVEKRGSPSLSPAKWMYPEEFNRPLREARRSPSYTRYDREEISSTSSSSSSTAPKRQRRKKRRLRSSSHESRPSPDYVLEG
ncbi:unnamed protein product [Symbiodinium natans]|uniref:Methyltransferase type 11 domain-containing protein n=1 Tax=Symbiodinium natans TaxID=878477 RepID=A0A812TT75_9DINO|nr:unnamed protein product [Symbiodinium natans]